MSGSQNSSKLIYLNSAASSFPKPPAVIKAVLDCLQNVPADPARGGLAQPAGDLVQSCREKVARLFGVGDPSQVVFTSGSTEALNLAIFGLPYQKRHFITTAIEHNSVLRPLKTLERDGQIRLTVISCDEYGEVRPEEVERAIGPDTLAVVFNHCSNVTGQRLDLAGFCKLARRHSLISIVDAAQSAGVFPIDVSALGVDLLAFSGHKALGALPGVGGLCFGRKIDLKPLKVGGTGIRSDLLFQPEEWPLRYEAGTINLPGLAALGAGLEHIFNLDIGVRTRRVQAVVSQMASALRELPGITLYGPAKEGRPTTMFCFNIEGTPPEAVGYLLQNSFGIVTRTGLHCAPLLHPALGTYPRGSVRVSPSPFTTADEVESFLKAMQQICRNKRALAGR